MTGVELTVRVPCATCGGTGEVGRTEFLEGTIETVSYNLPCIACDNGTVCVAVSCASCAHADVTDPWSPNHRVWCFEHDHEFDATFGCTRWQAKEGTDGNG